MNEPLDKIIRETLKAEKPPGLSPFLTAKVVNRIKSKRQTSRWARPVLIGYWCLISGFTVLLLTNTAWSFWTILIFLALVPVSFLLTVFRSISE